MDEDEAIKCAWLLFEQGLEKLRQSAEMLRSEYITASPSAMMTEQVLSRAIDALSTTGFMPKVTLRKA